MYAIGSLELAVPIPFVPDELGLWRYQWTQTFAEHPYESEVGYFDVLGGDLESLQMPLEKIAQLASTHKQVELKTMSPLMLRFARLERSAMGQLTPEVYRSEQGRHILSVLRKTRAALAGGPVPDSIPMIPDAPPNWARVPQKKKK